MRSYSIFIVLLLISKLAICDELIVGQRDSYWPGETCRKSGGVPVGPRHFVDPFTNIKVIVGYNECLCVWKSTKELPVTRLFQFSVTGGNKDGDAWTDGYIYQDIAKGAPVKMWRRIDTYPSDDFQYDCSDSCELDGFKPPKKPEGYWNSCNYR